MKSLHRKLTILTVVLALVSVIFAGNATWNTAAPVYADAAASGIKKAAAGESASYALDNDGQLFAWGLYGDFFVGGHRSPDRIDFFDGQTIADIVTSGNNLVVLLGDGTVWMHTKYGKELFVQVPGLKDITSIHGEGIYFFAIDSKGILSTWVDYPRNPESFSLNQRTKPIADLQTIYNGHAIKKDGTVYYLGLSGTEEESAIEGLTDVVKIAGSANGPNYALKSDGTVWMWGQKEAGGLALRTGESWARTPIQVQKLADIKDIAAGDRHFLALKNDGSVWAWGKNDYYQLGNGSRTDSASPVKVKDLKQIVSISSGYGYNTDHSFAIDANGKLWAWGANTQGQTGTNDEAEYVKSPRQLFFASLQNGKNVFELEKADPAKSHDSIAIGENGLFLAINNGSIQRSADYGKTWTKQKAPARLDYGHVSYIALTKTFLLRTDDNHYYLSKDGIKWTKSEIKSKNGKPLNYGDIQRIKGQYVMVTTTSSRTELAEESYVLVSKDAMNWSQVGIIPETGVTLVWNGKLYTALAGGYLYEGKPTTRNQFKHGAGSGGSPDVSAEMIVFTSNDLQKWVMQSGSLKDLRYLGFNMPKQSRLYWPSLLEVTDKGVIVLTDDIGNVIESADGITFKPTRKIAQLHNIERSDMFWNGSQYLIYIRDSYLDQTYLLVSKDKKSWSKRALSGFTRGFHVAQTGNRFIAYNHYGMIAESKDGINWAIKVKEKPHFNVINIDKENGLYFATGTQNAEAGWLGAQIPAILTSKDGKNWTRRFAAKLSELADDPVHSVASSGKGYVAATNHHALTSPDGVSWTARSITTSAYIKKVVWTGSAYMAIGNNTNYKGSVIYSSKDGVKWKSVYNTNAWLLDIAANKGKIAVVGYEGEQAVILGSSDGASWKKTVKKVGKDLSGWTVNNEFRHGIVGVQWVKDRFLIMSDHIYSSTDGVTWTTVDSDYRRYVEDMPMPFINGQIFWTGKEYRYITSTAVGVSKDMKTWTFYDLNLGGNTLETIWTGSEMMIAATNGLFRLNEK